MFRSTTQTRTLLQKSGPITKVFEICGVVVVQIHRQELIMVESQIDLAEGELVSDFEFILPWDVIETCCSLKPQGTSCFVSLNKQAKTSNQLFVSKLEDNSIKIRIRGKFKVYLYNFGRLLLIYFASERFFIDNIIYCQLINTFSVCLIRQVLS